MYGGEEQKSPKSASSAARDDGFGQRPERETARQKIDELLQKNRKTWNDLIELLQVGGVSNSAWDVGDDDRAANDEQTTDSDVLKEHAKEPDTLDLLHFIIQGGTKR